MKELSLDELLNLFEDADCETRESIGALTKRAGVIAIVVFENQNFDSSHFGANTAVVVGPGCTLKSVEECEGKHLYDLPSQRQYPVGAYYLPAWSARCDCYNNHNSSSGRCNVREVTDPTARVGQAAFCEACRSGGCPRK